MTDLTLFAIGEVIEAGTARFVAQCPRDRLHEPPEFGTFVKILPPGVRLPSPEAQPPLSVDPFADPPAVGPLELSPATPDDTLYAIVCSASTGSSELGRRPSAYGLDEAQLRAEQPQIFDLLATEFAAIHVGFARAGRFRPYLPPRPPRLHALVDGCTSAEVCTLTEAPDLLRSLLGAGPDGNTDELIAACLRHAYACRGRDFPFLVRMGKQLALLLRDDPDRLSAILRKLEP